MRKISLSIATLAVVSTNLFSTEGVSLIATVNDINKRLSLTENYLYYTNDLVTRKEFEKTQLSLKMLEINLKKQSEKLSGLLSVIKSDKLEKIMKTIDKNFNENLTEDVKKLKNVAKLNKKKFNSINKKINNINNKIEENSKSIIANGQEIDLIKSDIRDHTKFISKFQKELLTINQIKYIVQELTKNKDVLNKVYVADIGSDSWKMKEKIDDVENQINELEKLFNEKKDISNDKNILKLNMELNKYEKSINDIKFKFQEEKNYLSKKIKSLEKAIKLIKNNGVPNNLANEQVSKLNKQLEEQIKLNEKLLKQQKETEIQKKKELEEAKKKQEEEIKRLKRNMVLIEKRIIEKTKNSYNGNNSDLDKKLQNIEMKKLQENMNILKKELAKSKEKIELETKIRNDEKDMKIMKLEQEIQAAKEKIKNNKYYLLKKVNNIQTKGVASNLIDDNEDIENLKDKIDKMESTLSVLKDLKINLDQKIEEIDNLIKTQRENNKKISESVILKLHKFEKIVSPESIKKIEKLLEKSEKGYKKEIEILKEEFKKRDIEYFTAQEKIGTEIEKKISIFNIENKKNLLKFNIKNQEYVNKKIDSVYSDIKNMENIVENSKKYIETTIEKIKLERKVKFDKFNKILKNIKTTEKENIEKIEKEFKSLILKQDNKISKIENTLKKVLTKVIADKKNTIDNLSEINKDLINQKAIIESTKETFNKKYNEIKTKEIQINDKIKKIIINFSKLIDKVKNVNKISTENKKQILILNEKIEQLLSMQSKEDKKTISINIEYKKKVNNIEKEINKVFENINKYNIKIKELEKINIEQNKINKISRKTDINIINKLKSIKQDISKIKKEINYIKNTLNDGKDNDLDVKIKSILEKMNNNENINNKTIIEIDKKFKELNEKFNNLNSIPKNNNKKLLKSILVKTTQDNKALKNRIIELEKQLNENKKEATIKVFQLETKVLKLNAKLKKQKEFFTEKIDNLNNTFNNKLIELEKKISR